MTENPYGNRTFGQIVDGKFVFEIWDEGYEACRRDAVELIQSQHGYTDKTLESLKKVSE